MRSCSSTKKPSTSPTKSAPEPNNSRGYGFLVDQLNRAALSISANIAEGNGRFTKADRRDFFGIARGSVQECVPLLELARWRGLVTSEVLMTLDLRAPNSSIGFARVTWATEQGRFVR